MAALDGAVRTAGRKVIGQGHLKNALVFALKFAVAAPVLTVLFWWLSPAYLAMAGRASMAILNAAFDAGIESVQVNAGGILNTETKLAFVRDGLARPIQLVGLVMGIPAFLALTAASPWPGVRRFAAVVAIGCAILFVTHIAYVVLLFQFAQTMQRSQQIPYMIVMLPFLLWLVLSYWRQIAAYFDDAAKAPPPGE